MKHLVLIALLLLSAPALAVEAPEETGSPGTASQALDPGVAARAPEPSPPSATPKKWEVIPNKSSITFHAKQMGTEFEGVIGKFTADIAFDETNLDASKVTVDIDVSSIDAKDGERTKALLGSDWFDPARFPAARFETTKFTKTGDGAFTADANLTIRDVSLPVQLPFTLVTQAVGFGQDRTVMTGSVTVDRSKFQLGQGDWADPSVIANDVVVNVTVTATPAAN